MAVEGRRAKLLKGKDLGSGVNCGSQGSRNSLAEPENFRMGKCAKKLAGVGR